MPQTYLHTSHSLASTRPAPYNKYTQWQVLYAGNYLVQKYQVKTKNVKGEKFSLDLINLAIDLSRNDVTTFSSFSDKFGKKQRS